MVLTVTPDTELTSRSCGGGGTAGSAESRQSVSKLLQAEQRLLFPSSLLVGDPG